MHDATCPDPSHQHGFCCGLGQFWLKSVDFFWVQGEDCAMPIEKSPARNGDLPILLEGEEIRLSEPKTRCGVEEKQADSKSKGKFSYHSFMVKAEMQFSL